MENKLIEEANEKVVEIIKNISSTPEMLAEINVVWTNYCRQVIQETPKEKLKDIILPCFACMRAVFHKLSVEPKIQEFSFGEYLNSQTGSRTKVVHGNETRTVINQEHFFKCGICEHGSAFSFGEE